MILFIVTTIVSGAGAVFLSYRKTAHFTERIKFESGGSAALIEDQTKLARMAINDLEQMQKSKNKDASRVANAGKALLKLLDISWNMNGFFGKKSVHPFVISLGTTLDSQDDLANDDFIYFLKVAILELTPDCVELIRRDEDGDKVTTFTYNATEMVKKHDRLLQKYNQQRLQIERKF